MVTTRCRCGETYYSEERHIGSSLLCKRCGEIIPITTSREYEESHTASVLKTRRRETQPASAWNDSFRCTNVRRKTPARLHFAERLRRSFALSSGRALAARLLPLVLLLFVIAGGWSLLKSLKSKPEPDAGTAASARSATAPPTKAFTPEPTPAPESPANGTDLVPPRGSSGRGTLKVTNGTNHDAIVRLADSGSRKTRRLVYVRANSEITIKGIGSGSCILQFSTGVDFDRPRRTFLRDQEYSQFDDALEFRETRRILELNPIPEGAFEDNEIGRWP